MTAMKNLGWLPIFLLAVIVLAASTAGYVMPFGATAIYSFPNGSINSCSTSVAVTNNTLNSPKGMTIYNSTLLFVADNNNHRVLLVDIKSGKAIAVFGQPNYTGNAFGTTQNSLYFPYSLYVESTTGRLWISEANNNRVSRFDNAVTRRGANIAASGVIGQPNFTSNVGGTTRTQFVNLRGIFVDEVANRLWVADRDNKRAVWFNNPASANFKLPASGVIGTTSTTAFTSVGTQLPQPYAVHVDTLGRLYVTDITNNNVYRYDNATNNVRSVVFGQPAASSTSAASLLGPKGLRYDPLNDVLFIADTGNNRITGYINASTIKTNGTNATIFIGQSSATGNVASCSAKGLANNYELFYDAKTNYLWVGDANNNRVVAYLIPPRSSNSPSVTKSQSKTSTTTLTATSSLSPARSTSPVSTRTRTNSAAPTQTISGTHEVSVTPTNTAEVSESPTYTPPRSVTGSKSLPFNSPFTHAVTRTQTAGVTASRSNSPALTPSTSNTLPSLTATAHISSTPSHSRPVSATPTASPPQTVTRSISLSISRSAAQTPSA